MKTKKLAKMAAGLLLAVTMLTTLACGGDSKNGDSNNNKGVENDNSAMEGNVSEEKRNITITAFTQGPEQNISTFAENEFFQNLANKTGVTIQFQHPIAGNESTELDLMFSSGEYTDIIMEIGSTGYKDGDDAAIENGVYKDLTDYVEKYMPNYWSLINSNDEVKHLAYTDGGKIASLVSVEYDVVDMEVSAQPAFAGMMIRKDWLDQVNMEVPVTYDDWTAVLHAFKDEIGCEQPLYLSSNGYYPMIQFAAGYGAKSDMQVENGTIAYGPLTDGWKQYVTLMHQWYEEGLISSEYLTNDPFGMDMSKIGTNECGAFFGVYTMKSTMEGMLSEVGGGEIVACQLPVMAAGEVAQAGSNDGKLASKKYHISTHLSDEYLPQVLEMFDYMYSEEGLMLASYGVEGDTYTMDADGKPMFTDKIIHNPDGLSVADAIDLYLCPANLQLIKDWSRENITTPNDQLEMCSVWDKDGADLYIPTLNLTQEESGIYAKAMADVETYMKEATNNFIMGIWDIDEKWDEYVETLNGMKVEEAIAAYQSAYDRYMSK